MTSRRLPILLPVAVAVVTVVVFARLAWCDFTVWDDAGTIAANPRLRPPSWSAVAFYWTTIGERTPGQLYTPVTYTVWEAVAAAAGVRAWAFHGANVLLHATAAVLAYGLLRRLFGRPWAAAAGAVVFALHPVQVESVGWASGTKDVLCGLFSIAALSAYAAAVGPPPGPAGPAAGSGRPPLAAGVLPYARRPPVAGRGRRRLRYLAATALFLLAMLSKPTALVVPLMAFAVDVLLVGRPWRTAARWLWPWVVLMVPCALWTRAAQPAPWASPVPAWTRPLIATDAVAFDLGKVAWPVHLGVDYGRRPTAAYASGAIWWTWLVPAAVAAAVLWRRSEPLAAAAVLFALPIVPVSGLVPFDFQFYSTVSDHYLYLPMLGVAVAVTWALTPPAEPGANGGRVRRWPWGVAAVVLTALAVRSATQAAVWQDTRSLFAHGLAVNPASFVSCDMLGYVTTQDAKAERGDAARRAGLERSLGWYRASLDRFPGYVPSLVNIAINAGRLGRADEVRAALRRVARLQPTLPAAMKMDPLRLGQWMIDSGDPAGAAAYLDGVCRADPTDMPALFLRARAAQAAAPGGRPGPGPNR